MTTKSTKKGSPSKTGVTTQGAGSTSETSGAAAKQEQTPLGTDATQSQGDGNGAEATNETPEVLELKARVAELEEQLKAGKANATATESKTSNKPGKVKVKHGVLINGKKYTKDQIEADPSIQEYLVAIKSGAVETAK